MRKAARAGFVKLRRRWERHRQTCDFCRRAVAGRRKLHRPCDVERYLYERAEAARVRALAGVVKTEAS